MLGLFGILWNHNQFLPDCFKLFMNYDIIKLVFDETTLYLNQFPDKHQNQEAKIPNIYKNLSLNYQDIWLFLGVTI